MWGVEKIPGQHALAKRLMVLGLALRVLSPESAKRGLGLVQVCGRSLEHPSANAGTGGGRGVGDHGVRGGVFPVLPAVFPTYKYNANRQRSGLSGARNRGPSAAFWLEQAGRIGRRLPCRGCSLQRRRRR